MKPYREGVTKEQILIDGWSRGFQVKQTRQELDAMGFGVTDNYIKFAWSIFDLQMEAERPLKWDI